MNQHLNKKTPEQMVEAIFALDLDPIKFKLMDQKEGQGWSRAKVDAVELEYRRFLALTAKYPEQVIAPNTDVDKFWHGHILDTMKYAEDCEKVFGYFLHHFPYFGMRDEEDAANLANAAVNTRKLYEQEFGAAGKREASAYCAVAADKESAYCAATVEKKSAYCAVAQASFCSATPDVKQAAAYCAAAADKESAYCAATVEQKSAYCAVTQASFCSATPDVKQAATSYCGVVTAKGRPKLESVKAA